MTREQLQFFMNEVLGILDWSEEEEAAGTDPLDYVRAEIESMKNKNNRFPYVPSLYSKGEAQQPTTGDPR